jgi:hypothetical protein
MRSLIRDGDLQQVFSGRQPAWKRYHARPFPKIRIMFARIDLGIVERDGRIAKSTHGQPRMLNRRAGGERIPENGDPFIESVNHQRKWHVGPDPFRASARAQVINLRVAGQVKNAERDPERKSAENGRTDQPARAPEPRTTSAGVRFVLQVRVDVCGFLGVAAVTDCNWNAFPCPPAFFWAGAATAIAARRRMRAKNGRQSV